jgi:hypothetical protein
MKRKNFIQEIETKLNCTLVSKSATLLHFKANTDDCPSNAEMLSLLPESNRVRRQHNILFERPNPKPYEAYLIFVGMENIPNYLTNTFGGHSPKPHIWRLYNMYLYDTDVRGFKQEVLPTAEEVKVHIQTIYHILNPNRIRDCHKMKVELFRYNASTELWECGSKDYKNVLFVNAPSYLSEYSSIYINTYKNASQGFSRIYEYYGKDLCKQHTDEDFAKLFSLYPDAIYDWFYSEDRTIEDVAKMFASIERSYVLRPYLYYCKGEYNKIRQIFLIETMKLIHLKSRQEILSLPKRMRDSMSALCKKKLVSPGDIANPYFKLIDVL